MGKVKEFFELWMVNLVVQKREFIEFLQVVFKYYRNFTFAKIDISLLLLYFFKNPFKISKDFLIKKGEPDVYVYGETPLTTLERIAKKCHISQTDKVFELGCGRGRSCFWLHSFIKCDVVGIEYVPEFIERANKIKDRFLIEGVTFLSQDMLEANFEGATFIYLYGTCYDTEFIKKLIKKFKMLPSGTKFLTVSYALNEYSDEKIFSTVQEFSAPFTWGEATVYFQILT